jgi:hypothetical protein
VTDDDRLRDIGDALSELPPEDLQAILGTFRPAGAALAGLPGLPAPPSRRRPRRNAAVTYRVRIDLLDTRPPLWRRLELSSDLFLDELHEVIQLAFGWTDSHLHEFHSGSGFFGRDAEHYLCPFQVEEGNPGIPEERVRLDEVLVDAGDTLFYWYDFGDDWRHVITLEAVLPRTATMPRARCTAGRRPGPPEDCGGVGGYELVVAAGDPSHPDHAEALTTYREWYGDDADPDNYRPTPFDVDEINNALTVFGEGEGVVRAVLDEPGDDRHRLPAPVAALLGRARTSPGRRKLLALIHAAGIGQPLDLDPDLVADIVRPYRCLLDHVGVDGIALTSAGYLPPRIVEAIFTELGMADRWIGKANREDLTLPILELRESAQKLGLIRKYRGRLNITKKTLPLRDDPVALWWHIAERTVPSISDPLLRDAGLVYLCAVAGDSAAAEQVTAELLTDFGWRSSAGAACTRANAVEAVHDVRSLLDRLGLLRRIERFGPRTQPAEGARLFARAVLQGRPS